MSTYNELQTKAEAWADIAAKDANDTRNAHQPAPERIQYKATIALAYAQLAANALYDQRVPYKPTGRFGPQ